MVRAFYLPGFIFFIFAALLVLGLGFLLIRWIIGTPGRRKAALFVVLFALILIVPLGLYWLVSVEPTARMQDRNPAYQKARPEPMPPGGNSSTHPSVKQEMVDLVTLTDETVNAWKQPPEK